MTVNETRPVVAGGDFDGFFRAHYRAVTGLAYALCGDMGQAEDLVQDAFTSAHRAWARVASFDDPAGWVRRAVANRAISLHRKRSAESRALVRWASRREPPAAGSALDDDGIWRLVRALPRRQAQVIALTYLEDLDVPTIARLLRCGEPSVKTHLRRARATLARQLEVDDEEDAR